MRSSSYCDADANLTPTFKHGVVNHADTRKQHGNRELERRGVYTTSYEEGTLREKLYEKGRPHVAASHPAAKYRFHKVQGSLKGSPSLPDHFRLRTHPG
jgi:hypothetical protein